MDMDYIHELVLHIQAGEWVESYQYIHIYTSVRTHICIYYITDCNHQPSLYQDQNHYRIYIYTYMYLLYTYIYK
jgi:hypothetical protein